MSRFTLPRDIYYGRGALSALSGLKGTRAMIVSGGSSMKAAGFLQETEEHLQAAGMEVAHISGVEPDPSVETVQNGARQMRDFAPDWIVAIGGGSPIDAAKAMWVFYEHPDTDFDALTVPFSFPALRNRARFAAIPSTSGTATEVTAFSVITDNEKGIKYPLADFEITPDVAILDPRIAETMPQKLVALTGMDALTHAIEAYVSTAAGPFTDPLAMAAIRTIFNRLPASYDGDKAAKEDLHYAQCLAGMAFSNALLGIVHSLAHKTGAAFSSGHITHGLANALYLPYVISFNAKDERALARYAAIASAAGLRGVNDRVLTAQLILKIKEFCRGFSIPEKLADLQIDRQEFDRKKQEIAANAVADACTGSNPRPVTTEEMIRLLEAIYAGDPVDF